MGDPRSVLLSTCSLPAMAAVRAEVPVRLEGRPAAAGPYFFAHEQVAALVPELVVLDPDAGQVAIDAAETPEPAFAADRPASDSLELIHVARALDEAAAADVTNLEMERPAPMKPEVDHVVDRPTDSEATRDSEPRRVCR